MAVDVTVRPLEYSRSTISDLQRVLEAAPGYFVAVTGRLARPAEAEALWSALPVGKRADDKFIYGIFQNRHLVGCADVIRAFPDSATAYIGLLLVAETSQRRGIGGAAYALVEEALCSWGSCSRVLLAVVRANDGVLGFWKRMGFAETGETRPYTHGTVVSETIMLAKAL